MNLETALRNAIEAENYAAYFYDTLAGVAEDRRAGGFLRKMAAQERRHAARIEELGRQLGAGELPANPSMEITSVETAAGFEHLDELGYREALRIARSAEYNAARTYEALAELFEGPQRELFELLAEDERGHFERIETLHAWATANELDYVIEFGEFRPSTADDG
jgi:rubrerythrin